MVNDITPNFPADFTGYNGTGASIPAFSAVRIVGATNDVPEIALAQSDDAATMPCAGITIGEIEDGCMGTVRTFNIIYDIDTSAYVVDDPLYVDETTPGGFRTTSGAPASIDQRVATVLVSSAAAGQVLVCLNQQMDGYASYTNRQQFEIYTTTPTPVLRMIAAGAGETVISVTPTAPRVLTLPDATDTLVGKATTDTLTNKDFPDSELKVQCIGDATKRLLFRSGETLTSDRRLNIILGDANRQLTIAGTASVSGTNTGDQNLTEVIALADLTDVTTKTGTGTTVVMQGSPSLTTPTIADLTNATHTHQAAASGGLLHGLSQLMDTSGRCVRSTLANANTGFLLTSGTAYFVYLGRVTVTSTFAFVRFSLRIAGAGAQTAEVGFFSSSTAPSRANQSMTKLAATGTVDDLTSLGVKGNTSSLAISVAAGTHLWAGVRTAMATTQPSLYGLIGDKTHGRILSTAGSGALTGAGPWTGALITDGGTTLAPDLDGALD